jgi:peptidyl-tRNA hydrolase, PTH2 family
MGIVDIIKENKGAALWIAGASLLLASTLIRRKRRTKRERGPCKAVLLVRTDLKMEKGKILAQGLHAAYELGKRKGSPLVRTWERGGSKKITLRVHNEQQMKERVLLCKKRGIEVIAIRDAGHTQVPSGSWTVSLVGPEEEHLIDEVTGDLKLY